MVCQHLRPDQARRAVCCAASEASKKREGMPQAIAAMRARGGGVQFVGKHELNLVTENRPHQARTVLHALPGPLTHPLPELQTQPQEKSPGGHSRKHGKGCVSQERVFAAASCGCRVQGLGFCVTQGLVLDCSALDWEPLEEFPEAASLAAAANGSGRQPVWLALDEIGDPVRHPALICHLCEPACLYPDVLQGAKDQCLGACNAAGADVLQLIHDRVLVAATLRPLHASGCRLPGKHAAVQGSRVSCGCVTGSHCCLIWRTPSRAAKPGRCHPRRLLPGRGRRAVLRAQLRAAVACGVQGQRRRAGVPAHPRLPLHAAHARARGRAGLGRAGCVWRRKTLKTPYTHFPTQLPVYLPHNTALSAQQLPVRCQRLLACGACKRRRGL